MISRSVAAITAVLMAFEPGFAQTRAPPKSDRAPEVRLSGRKVTLPLIMVGQYPFVEAEIAGVRGKLMLDTGSEQALAVNDHRIKLRGGVPIGTGHFGSGQTFSVRLQPSIRTIHIGTLTFPKATLIQSQDARMLEAITPDFLGWLGYNFWAKYAVKLDYRRSEVSFFRDGPGDYLRDERVIAVLPFETRKLPNHPIMPIQIGDVRGVAAFDTGQDGSLWTSPALKRRLIRTGRLSPSPEKAGSFNLSGLSIGRYRLAGISKLDVATKPDGGAAPIGISENTVLSVGYSFLKRYKTVWDYRRHRIYLLER